MSFFEFLIKSRQVFWQDIKLLIFDLMGSAFFNFLASWKLMGKIEEHEGKKYLTTDDYGLDWVLYKTEMIIDINKFNNSKILINSNNNLVNEVVLKNNVILISWFVRDRDKFYPQLFLEKTLIAHKSAGLVKCWLKVVNYW